MIAPLTNGDIQSAIEQAILTLSGPELSEAGSYLATLGRLSNFFAVGTSSLAEQVTAFEWERDLAQLGYVTIRGLTVRVMTVVAADILTGQTPLWGWVWTVSDGERVHRATAIFESAQSAARSGVKAARKVVRDRKGGPAL